MVVIVAGEEREAVKKQQPRLLPPQFSGTERWLAAVKKIESQSLVRLLGDVYKALFKQTAGSCATWLLCIPRILFLWPGPHMIQTVLTHNHSLGTSTAESWK